MDLDDEELKATRKLKGLDKATETKRYIRSLEKRIIELEQIEQEHQKENGKLREKIKEYEKQHKDLVKVNKRIYDIETIENMCNELANSISKDKIREKIEEINKEELNYNEDDYWIEQEVKGYAIDNMKELLEE